MDINQLLLVVQEQIPTITLGLGLLGTLVSSKVASKKKDKELLGQASDIKELKVKVTEQEKILNDTKNSKAVLKIARQHEDRLLRLEKQNEEKKD